MAPTDSHNLTYDEYVDLRNEQDGSLNKEFTSIRSSIDKTNTKVDKLETKVDKLETKVDKLETTVNEFRAEQRAINADLRKELRDSTNELRTEMRNVRTAMRNGAMNNPRMPIHAPIIYDYTKQKLVEPNRALFPRHAKEFYALRDPITEPRRKMLLYLASFYDIEVDIGLDTSEGDSSEDKAVLSDPIRIVDTLENILGLQERKFIKFTERALEVRFQSASTKKRWYTEPDPTEPAALRRRLDIRTSEASPEHKSTSSNGESGAYVGWGLRTTPSSQRPTVNQLSKVKPEPADSGTPINPVTTPRGYTKDPGLSEPQ